MNSRHKPTNSATLRDAAEQMASWAIVNPLYAETDARKLLHELQVHHIELEMQNAELNMARFESDKAIKNITDINQDLKQTMSQVDTDQANDELVRRDAIVKISHELATSLKEVAQISKEIRASNTNPQLLVQLDKLELAGARILHSINSL